MIKVAPLVLCFLACSAGYAELSSESSIRSTSLTLGHGWACVRELRSLTLSAGEQEVVLEGIPREADLSTLVLHSWRVPIELLECRRQRPVAARQGPDVRWTAGKGFAGDSEGRDQSGPVLCRIRSPTDWAGMGVDVSYVMTGFDWSASYQVAVRGDQEDDKEPVSVDLSGLVRIENRTSRSFANADVRLAGGASHDKPDFADGPGFLSLDDESPLADLWREKPKGRQPEFDYQVPHKVDLKACTETDVVLIRTVRTPATRMYTMTAEDFSPASEDRDAPLRKRIVFRNISANRMGIALPPGRVQIYLGSLRGRLLQQAFFERTPVNGTIQIDLGLAEDVRGLRITGKGSDPVAGYFERTFLVVVRNHRETDITCEIDEKPPVILEWDVINATRSFTESGHRLRFNVEIKARTEEIIEYKLRIRQPEL